MDFQLVLRFRTPSITSHNEMIALEESLSETLDDTEELDGHDFGIEEADLFILTPDPATTFRRIKPLLERSALLASVTAAYGHIDAEDYLVIWPEGGLSHPFTR